jgi:hypothetical protein
MHNRTLRLFQPTLLSLGVSIVLAILLLGNQALRFLPGNETLYNLVYGEDSFFHLLQTSNNNIIDIYYQLTASSSSYIVFVVLIALTVGAAVYLIAQLVNRLLYDVASTWHIWAADPHITAGSVRDIALRTLFRIGMVLLWLAYSYITVKIIWPFCIVAVNTGIGVFPSADSALYIGGYGLALFVAVLHLHVVFLRLIALRTRLIGKNY